MKTLILLFCILNGASFYPIKYPRANLFELFQRNYTSQNIDVHYLLKNVADFNPVTRSNGERDSLDVVTRQRRSTSSQSTETGNCKYVDFTISFKEEFGVDAYPPTLNIGACLGGPMIFGNRDIPMYSVLLQNRLANNNSRVEYPLLHFKQETQENSDATVSLSYDIAPSCKVTFKPALIRIYDKNSYLYVNIPNIKVDTCS